MFRFLRIFRCWCKSAGRWWETAPKKIKSPKDAQHCPRVCGLDHCPALSALPAPRNNWKDEKMKKHILQSKNNTENRQNKDTKETK